VDVGTRSRAHDREPDLRPRPGGSALMLPYIITGIVAVVVTLYLFAALLFPERF
jgi:K+-transporting ATPase KdpF subunit